MDIHLQKNRVFVFILLVLCLTQVNPFKVNCTRDSECTYDYYCCSYQCKSSKCASGTNTQCVNGDGCEDNFWDVVCCGTTCQPFYKSCPSTGIIVDKTNSTTTKTNTTTNGTESNKTSTSNSTTGESSGSNQTANSTSGSGNTSNGTTNNTDGSGSYTNSTNVIPTNGDQNTNDGSKTSNQNELDQSKTKIQDWCPFNCLKNDGTCLPFSQCLPLSNDLKQEKVDVLPSECSFWCPKSCCNGDGTCQPFSKCLGLCNSDFDCGTNWQSCCSSWSIDVGVFDDDLKAIFQSHYTDIRKGAYNETHCVDKQYVSTVNSEIANSLKSITDRQLKIEVQCQQPWRLISFLAILFVIAGLVAINIWSCIFLKRKIRQRGLINPIPIQVNQSNERIFNQFDSTLDSFNLDDEDGQNTHAYQDIEVSDTEEDPKNTMGAK